MIVNGSVVQCTWYKITLFWK